MMEMNHVEIYVTLYPFLCSVQQRCAEIN